MFVRSDVFDAVRFDFAMGYWVASSSWAKNRICRRGFRHAPDEKGILRVGPHCTPVHLRI